jgi:hypothetical protein
VESVAVAASNRGKGLAGELETPPSTDPPPAVEVVAEEINEQMQGNKGSPQLIDQAIQQQGRDLHQLLQMFKQSNSEPLSSFIMQTPKHKSQEDKGSAPSEGDHQVIQRKNLRQQTKNSAGKIIIKKAQELIANRCGFLEEGKERDNMTLQHYLNMYKNPLSEEAIEAIVKLTQVTEVKKKTMKVGKKKKEVAETREQVAKMEGKKKGKKNSKAVPSKLADVAA